MEDHENMYEICIKKGHEHRATLTPNRVNSTTEFFFNAYQDAKLQLREIVLASSRVQEDKKKELSTKKKLELLHKYPNNVIAFCADRGRGKTTAMLSFSNALEMMNDCQKGHPETFWGTIPGCSNPLDVRFEVMAPIDPASMENSESVLQQIISQLFENFCKEIKRNRHIYEAGMKDCNFDVISDKFQKCAQAIDSLYKDPKSRTNLIEDELDQIAEIGQSGKLLLLLHELINDYLDFMRDKDTTWYLVIQIDDADMDIGRSYQILEDVRKYLGLPRVIILMAVNIQQLETTVEQHFLQAYEQGLKYPGSMITVERCHNIAALYLEKAIPHTRRIHLPDIGETIRQHFSQLTVKYLDEAEQNILSENIPYQKQLLDLLHKKTGMVFTFEPEYLHNLLPTHMRELSQFLPFFTSMEDLSRKGKDEDTISNGYEIAVETFRYQKFHNDDHPLFLERWEKNLERLEFYLVHLWSAINLREGSRNLFREFAAQPETVRNLYLLRNIADYYVRERFALESTQSTVIWNESDFRDEFVRACGVRGIDLTSYSEETMQDEISISYADVMGVLAALTNLPGANRQYRFAYAIRLFYSIRLHRTLIQEIRALGKGSRTIDFATLSYLLRDTLLKSGPVNDTAWTPFGCWLLEIPIKWFQCQPVSNEIDRQRLLESPFLRWKYKKDHTIRTFSTIKPSIPEVWRPISISMGQQKTDIVVFNPLYPLLAALDRFICFKNITMIDDDIAVYMSQIYIALLVCLNWDVQRVLFKKVKNQSGDTIKAMASELYDDYIAELSTLVPTGMPKWLEPQCFFKFYQTADQGIFDVLTMRVHPVPEFKRRISDAKNGLANFNAALSILSHYESSISMKTLWEKADPTLKLVLNDMNDAVQDTIVSSRAITRCIQEELRKGQPLSTLFTDFLYRKPHSLKDSSLTPNQIKNALERYIHLLEQILAQGEDSENRESAKVQPALKTKRISGKDAPTAAHSSTDERESVAKTLQDLIRFGQQLLSILNYSEQETHSESEQ